MASNYATSKDAVIKQIDGLLADIFEKRSVPSQYHILLNEKINVFESRKRTRIGGNAVEKILTV